MNCQLGKTSRILVSGCENLVAQLSGHKSKFSLNQGMSNPALQATAALLCSCPIMKNRTSLLQSATRSAAVPEFARYANND
jgi:hypothetical protein